MVRRSTPIATDGAELTLRACFAAAVRWGRARLWGAVCVALTACAPDVLQPSLGAVQPGFGFNGAETPVTVTGQDLGPSLRALGVEGIDEDLDIELWLDNGIDRLQLQGLDAIDANRLDARVPAGATPGLYALQLRDESGQLDLLPAAFQVTDTQAAALVVTPAGLNFEVREAARLDLQVVDPAGQDVGLPVQVELRAERGEGGAEGVRFDEGLVDQVAVGEGVVRGWLEPGGSATLRLTSDVVDRVRVTAAGVGPDAFLRGQSDWLYFEAGSLAGVRVEPLLSTDSVMAGETFPLRLTLVDRDGNPTRGERAWLTVHETCAPSGPGFEVLVRVDDSATLPGVFLTGASTPDRCPGNQLRAFGSAEGVAVVGVSEPIVVQAGPLQRLDVQVARAEVRAGDDDQPTWVEALDAFGNRADDPTGELRLWDDAGGLDTAAGVGAARCTSFDGGLAACDLRLLRAAERVRVRAEVEGAEGVSLPFAVIAGSPATLVAEGPPVATAGQAFAVALRLEDAWGNARGLAVPEAATATWDDGSPGLRCVPVGGADPGAFSCETTLARPSVQVTVDLDLLDLRGRTNTFAVLNGDLAVIDVTAASSSPSTAGDRRAFLLVGADSWGNPFVAGGPVSVDLREAAAPVSIGTVTLDPTGAATVNPQFIVASDENALVVSRFGIELGRSTPFVVEPGGWARLALSTLPPWVELGFPLEIAVFATDVYGNPTPSATGTVQLASIGGLGDPLVAPLSGGRADFRFAWHSSGVADALEASLDSFLARSSFIDVLDFECAAAPVVDVRLDGNTSLRLCQVGASTPMVGLNASASGAAPVVAWHFDDGAGTRTRGATASTTVRWSAPGAYAPTALAVTSAGCAAWGAAMAWVGPADGSPVGPVDIEVGASVLAADGSGASGAPVTVTAVDCLGDPAGGASLWVRPEVGQFSALTDPIDSSDGQRVTLDSDGVATLWWDVSGTPVPGAGRMFAGVPSGAAWGEGLVSVVGDATLPTVVDAEPGGSWSAAVDAVSVRFSEPMWAGSFAAGRVRLLGSDGAELPLRGFALSADGRTLRIEPSASLEPLGAPYTLILGQELRDQAGLRLDGARVGARSDFVLALGIASAPPAALLSCVVSAASFSPDGADGLGGAADRVRVQAEAVSAPPAWRTRVVDAQGRTRGVATVQASGSAFTWEWDGRDEDGRVVPDGSYLIELLPLDDAWGEGEPCEALVDVVQRAPAPPAWP